MNRFQKNNMGVTLIEMVLVVLLLGIMMAIATARWPSSADSTLGPQADLFAQYLRHVQTIAVQQGKTLTMSTSGAGYSVLESSVSINDPATNLTFSETLEKGVTLSVVSIDFDEMGRPETSGTGTLISTAQDFVLTGSSNTITVSVTPITGFVTITP